MNWINTEIDPFVIVSNSDAHSLENMGREGNIIE
jgi:PHP family Zn ribbon phosphoesterase